MVEQKCKITITVSNIASQNPCCLKNRQADPPWINGDYPEESRFLLKRYRVITFSFHVDALLRRFPQNTSPHNQQKLLKKWEDPNLEGGPNRAY